MCMVRVVHPGFFMLPVGTLTNILTMNNSVRRTMQDVIKKEMLHYRLL
ncbi:hypothetical protein [Brevibacillus sp. 179-C9.3 HS]